jgi:hypothetical protein
MNATQCNKALKKLKLTHVQFAKLVGRYDTRWLKSGMKGPEVLLVCLI